MYWYNIYQISQNPMDSENWITEEDFYMTSFLGDIATRIESSTEYERRDMIESLSKFLAENKLGKIENGIITLHPELLQQHYYSQRYVEFGAAVEKLKTISKQKFLDDLDGVRNAIFEVEGSLIKQQDHYVCWDSEEPIPLDEFLRTATPGKPYYIGGVCSYKY